MTQRDSTSLRAEVIVIGSGPGGALTACLLSEAGRDVLLIEEGGDDPQSSCEPFSSQEMLTKYRNGGVTVALGRTNVLYVEGRGSGGGSEINSGIVGRVAGETLDDWRRTHAVETLSEADLAPCFAANGRELRTSVPAAPAPAARKLQEGATRLGWQSADLERLVRVDAGEGGGPTRARRESMTETFIPRALRAGCRMLSRTRALHISRAGSEWQVLLERTAPGHSPNQSPVRLTARAASLFVAGGAVQTPALLRRSGFKTNVGNSLHLHPMVKVVAQFPDDVVADDWSMPSHQIREFSPRLGFGCSISKPAYLATILLSNPENLPLLDAHWRKMAAYYTTTRGGVGTVRVLPGFRDPLVRYHLGDADLRELSEGLARLCEVLFAAGATAVFPGIAGQPALRSVADLALIPDPLPQARTSVSTVHLMASCPLGENRSVCAADSFGQVHAQAGLYIADASLFCGAIGTNPQATVMALARRNAEHFLSRQ